MNASFPIAVVTWCLTQTAPVETTEPSVERPVSSRQLFVQLAFQHWFGNTFGVPLGLGTPSLVVRVRPGVRFLEVGLHYTFSLSELPLPDGVKSRVGFANVDVLASYEARGKLLRLVAGLGAMAGFIHTGAGVGFSFGPVMVTRIIYDLSDVFGLGFFADVRAQLYHLPGSPTPILSVSGAGLVFGHADAQLQSGIVLTFF